MSDYGLSVKKGDFELALNSNDPHWIAKEITLWREALLSGQLAQALAVHPVTQPLPQQPRGLLAPALLEGDDAALVSQGSETEDNEAFDTVLSALMEDMTEDFKQPESLALEANTSAISDPVLSVNTPEDEDAADLDSHGGGMADELEDVDALESPELPEDALTVLSIAEGDPNEADDETATSVDPPQPKAPARFKPLAVALPPSELDAQPPDGDTAELAPPPTASLVVDEQPSFAQWCQLVPPLSPIQSLLWASYYLTEYDHQSPFSLKALNALLAKADLACVNHSTLQDGLDDGLLQLMQETGDLTTTTQYHLTLEGAQETIRARQAKVVAPSRKKAGKK